MGIVTDSIVNCNSDKREEEEMFNTGNKETRTEVCLVSTSHPILSLPPF